MKYKEDDLFDLERKGIISDLPYQQLDKILKAIISPKKYKIYLKEFIENNRLKILEQLTEQEEIKFDMELLFDSITWHEG